MAELGCVTALNLDGGGSTSLGAIYPGYASGTTVNQPEDGALRAWPVPGRPGSPESFEANAYYMLPNGPGIEAPKPGDVI